MTITKITDSFSSSGVLSEEALFSLAKSGVSTIVNARPDNESPEQKNDEEWISLCQKYGLTYFHIPVLPCQYTQHDIQKFKEILEHSDKKVHGFCRTGTRAAHLFALANKEKYTFAQLQELYKNTPFDLSVIADKFN